MILSCFFVVWGFFSVKALVETRWCFVPHCMWTLWFLLRGFTGFSFANVLVFKPLLNYCMALFDSPLLSGYSFRVERKEEKGCLYWTAPFHLLDISLSVLRVHNYFWLLTEALNGPVASLLTLLKHMRHWCCLHCVHVELQDSSPWMLLVDGCVMQTISGSTGLAVLGSVSRLCLLQCALICVCALVIAFLPSVIKDLKSITLWLTYLILGSLLIAVPLLQSYLIAWLVCQFHLCKTPSVLTSPFYYIVDI